MNKIELNRTAKDLLAVRHMIRDLEDVGALVSFNHYVDIAQDIIDYGTAHPEAPFSDFLNFIKPGLYGVTEEELLEDD